MQRRAPMVYIIYGLACVRVEQEDGPVRLRKLLEEFLLRSSKIAVRTRYSCFRRKYYSQGCTYALYLVLTGITVPTAVPF